ETPHRGTSAPHGGVADSTSRMLTPKEWRVPLRSEEITSSRFQAPGSRHARFAAGGTPTLVTTLETASGDVQHSFPFFLPDGRHFLYFVVGSQASRTVPRGVYVGALDSKEPGKLIEPGGTNHKYANGYLIFLRNGALLAQPFDVDRLELGGQPVPLVDHVQTTGAAASDVAGAFTVSETGVLAYQTGSVVRSQLTWFDRAGTRLATLR